MTAPRLEAFRLHPHAPELVPSTADRTWMDAFNDRHAYRCLPLTIANAHCWEILAPGGFEISWNGRAAAEDLTVRPMDDWPATLPFEDFARSNFARGIVTLHTGYLFRTPPGWNLLATGPFNEPRLGIWPLSGIMESDWLPYPFTMNWQMLAPGTVRFHKDEAFCAVMPLPKSYLPDWEVAIHDLADDPVLGAEQQTFQASRVQFLARMQSGDQEAIKQAWQRHYFVGRHPDGTKVDEHVNKLRLAEPVDARGTRPLYARSATASPLAAEVLAAEAQAALARAEAQARTEAQVRAEAQGRAGVETAAVTQAARPPGPWRSDSILNDLEQRQTTANAAGRERLRDGRLAATAAPFELTPEVDTEALDFVVVPEFLDAAECRLLADVARSMSDQLHVDDIAESYWRGRIVFFADVLARHPDAAALMRRAQQRITERLQQFYALEAPVYADTVQLVQWREGMYMPPHADRANPDGTRHDMPHRDFGSIVYLNDDYAGGELYFTRLDMVLKPKAGMLVAFTGGWHHEHAVLRVNAGLRLTMPAFYTFDRGRLDTTFYS
ncbi:MAG: DUF6065 family protein [Acetobacteraceae bacterium]